MPWAEAVWDPGALHVEANSCHSARAFCERLRGCRTPDGEYCWPVWKEVWGTSPVSSQLQGVGRRTTGRGLLLSLGVKEALEAGSPGVFRIFLTDGLGVGQRQGEGAGRPGLQG